MAKRRRQAPPVVEPNAEHFPPQTDVERSSRTANVQRSIETAMNVGHCPHIISNTVVPEVVSNAPLETFRVSNAPATQHLSSTSSGVACQQVGSSHTIDSRLMIRPYGDSFLGAPGVVCKIKAIMRSHYEKEFRWNDQGSVQLKINWQKKCSKRLSALIGKARMKEKESGKGPIRIRVNFWSKMIKYFDSEEFKKISEVVKNNRSKFIGHLILLVLCHSQNLRSVSLISWNSSNKRTCSTKDLTRDNSLTKKLVYF